MKRLALALLSFTLPLSAQKTFVEVPENMVRTDPITENLANMKLSFGASPGPVVRPTEVKNDFLLSYKGVAIGDEVTIDKKKTGRVAELLQRHLRAKRGPRLPLRRRGQRSAKSPPGPE